MLPLKLTTIGTAGIVITLFLFTQADGFLETCDAKQTSTRRSCPQSHLTRTIHRSEDQARTNNLNSRDRITTNIPTRIVQITRNLDRDQSRRKDFIKLQNQNNLSANRISLGDRNTPVRSLDRIVRETFQNENNRIRTTFRDSKSSDRIRSIQHERNTERLPSLSVDRIRSNLANSRTTDRDAKTNVRSLDRINESNNRDSNRIQSRSSNLRTAERDFRSTDRVSQRYRVDRDNVLTIQSNLASGRHARAPVRSFDRISERNKFETDRVRLNMIDSRVSRSRERSLDRISERNKLQTDRALTSRRDSRSLLRSPDRVSERNQFQTDRIRENLVNSRYVRSSDRDRSYLMRTADGDQRNSRLIKRERSEFLNNRSVNRERLNMIKTRDSIRSLDRDSEMSRVRIENDRANLINSRESRSRERSLHTDRFSRSERLSLMRTDDRDERISVRFARNRVQGERSIRSDVSNGGDFRLESAINRVRSNMFSERKTSHAPFWGSHAVRYDRENDRQSSTERDRRMTGDVDKNNNNFGNLKKEHIFVTQKNYDYLLIFGETLLICLLLAQIIGNSSKPKKFGFRDLGNLLTFNKEKVF